MSTPENKFFPIKIIKNDFFAEIFKKIQNIFQKALDKREKVCYNIKVLGTLVWLSR